MVVSEFQLRAQCCYFPREPTARGMRSRWQHAAEVDLAPPLAVQQHAVLSGRTPSLWSVSVTQSWTQVRPPPPTFLIQRQASTA